VTRIKTNLPDLTNNGYELQIIVEHKIQLMQTKTVAAFDHSVHGQTREQSFGGTECELIIGVYGLCRFHCKVANLLRVSPAEHETEAVAAKFPAPAQTCFYDSRSPLCDPPLLLQAIFFHTFSLLRSRLFDFRPAPSSALILVTSLYVSFSLK